MVACEWLRKEASSRILRFVVHCANSNEALRLQPPVPSGSQRSVNKGKGYKLLGKL
jgi:hypothetical protein